MRLLPMPQRQRRVTEARASPMGVESPADASGESEAEAPAGEPGENRQAETGSDEGSGDTDTQPEDNDAADDTQDDAESVDDAEGTAAETTSYAPEVGEVGPPKTGPEITSQKVPASEVPEDKGRGGENGGGGRGDDSLTNKFNTAAAGKRPAPPATTGTDGGGRTAKGADSDRGGGPGISQTFTGTDTRLEEDEPLANYPGVKVSEEPDAKDRNVNRPKGPKL